MSEQRYTNHLSGETSPYLKQHAHNPVDWYPWGPEALERARELDRPIFLSIGYSACHWCHVMEHESFEDPEIAHVLNENFVSIKVDREERPDVDQIYMTALQLITRQGGGWPLSMFLTPELKPFYGGTYFPPDERYGRPSFGSLLLQLADAWRTRRDEIDRISGQVTEQLQLVGSRSPAAGELEPRLLQNAARALERSFDSSYGGFGAAPKFPHSTELRLLLRVWKRFGDEQALHMARVTLDHMARGGMYDQLGDGFHRYSTDERWLVPHFEKMLYDNALLSLAYLEAFQATGEPFYRQVTEETLDYVLRDMTSPEGPFYSAEDADSEGVEGKFYVWSSAEIERILGQERAKILTYVYDVNPVGSWEGHNILHRTKTDEQDARLLGVSVDELRRVLAECKRELLKVRKQRVRPGRDEKMLTSWNGLMIGAFAQAAQALGKPAYQGAAVRAAEFILRSMRSSEGRLFRTYSSGTQAKLNAYLEDYAFLSDAVISLYETTFEPRWIEEALRLADMMIAEFLDPQEGGFFYTGQSHESLIARTKDMHDSSTPSGSSMAVLAMLRLAKLTGRTDLQEKAEKTLRLYHELMASSPLAVGQMLVDLDFYLGPVQEFVVVGESTNEATREALRLIRAGFRPNKVVAFRSSEPSARPREELPPILADKSAKGPVVTYLCQDFVCQAPLVGVEALKTAITKESQ
jgi:uncharacterized protein YyaL (SSP411 family)